MHLLPPEVHAAQSGYLQQSKAIAQQFLQAPAPGHRPDPGLLTGLGGQALFLLHYSRLHGEQAYYNLGHSLLQNALDAVQIGEVVHTHCRGLAGLGWALMHLHEHGLLDADVNELLGSLDGYLEETLFFDLADGEYDFLHGAVGTALYFFRRTGYTPDAARVLRAFGPALEGLAIRSGDALKWESMLDEGGRRGYNISLSHGMASLVALLGKLYAAGIASDAVRPLLYGAVSYILGQELPPNQYTSCFPTYSLETEDQPIASRLAWCYGDLGIASALWLAGSAAGEISWREKAAAVFQRAARRTDLREAGVVDVSLCHGTAGIAHLFNRAYYHTGIAALRAARDYWLRQTMGMATYADGLAGYKSYHGKRAGYANDPCLLEGTAGIGLAFMAAANPLFLHWDECLLLS